jgi:hypothetical protein
VRRYVDVHPRVYQYSGTKKKFFTRRACAPTRYVHLSSTTYVVPEPLEAPYVPSKGANSLNRERYAMAVRGDGHIFPLRESYPQWYPPHCSPPEVVPYRLRRRRTWWWTGPPLTGGVWGGRMYDRNKTCRSSKTLLRGTAAYWEVLHGSP